MKVKDMALISIVAALYIAITFVLAPISFGMFQFRISEMLNVLMKYKRKYIYAMIIGVALANFNSPIGLIDVAFGVACAIVMGAVYQVVKNTTVATIINGIAVGILIGIMLHVFYGAPLILSMISVGVTQCITLGIGQVIFKELAKHESLKSLFE